MRLRIFFLGHGVLLLGILISFTGCLPSHNREEKAADGAKFSAVTADSELIYTTTLRPVLQQNCSGCHGANQPPLFATSDVNASHDILLGNGLVALDAPSTSSLVVKIRNGHQGFPMTFAATIQTQIENWAMMLQNSNPNLPVPTPTPSPNQSPPPAPNTANLAPSVASFVNTLRPLIQQNCAGCHSTTQMPFFAQTDPTLAHDLIISSGLAVLANPAMSHFVAKLQGGHQNVPAALAMDFQNKIQSWANMLSSANIPLPGQAPLTATFKSINERILIPKCVSCHGPTLAKARIRYDSYNNTLRTVVKGSYMQSKFYQSVASNSSEDGMPPNQQLSNAEIQAIRDWIAAGAPNN